MAQSPLPLPPLLLPPLLPLLELPLLEPPLLLELPPPPPPSFCCGALADDFEDEGFSDDVFDDFFLVDFFFLDFFFLVFFLVSAPAGLASVVGGCTVVAGFDSVSVAGFAATAGFGAGFGAAFAAGLAAGLRAPGVRKFGEVIDPGSGPELDVHGGPPIMPHACASRISLFAEVAMTSAKATKPSTNIRTRITMSFPDRRPPNCRRTTTESRNLFFPVSTYVSGKPVTQRKADRQGGEDCVHRRRENEQAYISRD